MTAVPFEVEIGANGTVIVKDSVFFGPLGIASRLSADEAEQLAFKLAATAEKSRAREWALSNGATTTTPTQSEFAE